MQEALLAFAESAIEKGEEDDDIERGQKTSGIYRDLSHKVYSYQSLTVPQLKIFKNGASIFGLKFPKEAQRLLNETSSSVKKVSQADRKIAEAFGIEDQPKPKKTHETITVTREEISDAIIEAFGIIREQLRKEMQ